MFGVNLNPAQIATQALLAAATGGTSLAVTTALRTVAFSIGDQILQNIGQQMGLPQPMIDVAQAAFHAEAGDVGGARQNLSEAIDGLGAAAGLSPSDAGSIQQQAQGAIDDASNPNSWTTDALREAGGDAKAAKGGKGDSLLVAIAKAMGKALDAKLNQMYADTQKMAGLDSKSSQYGSLSGEVQALGQEVSLISNALTNSIKSIGEAATTLVRKS